jgi:predicted acylesterase/phospholipase RssA
VVLKRQRRAAARPALVVFEGGGAKGIAHVGALAAIEAAGFRVRGVAGTSAGSIIAALAALGLSAREIADAEARTSVLGLLDPPLSTATELLGREWWKLAAARAAMTWWPALTLAAVALVAFVTGRLATASGAPGASVLLVMLLVGGTGLASAVYILGGVARLDPLERYLAAFSAARLGRDAPARFADFGVEGRPVLKMVATDLTRGTIQLFSPERTPDVAISEAVAASACIPLVFRPRRVRAGLPRDAGSEFVDGGLVSNLPAWVFDGERAEQPNSLTICIEIDEGAGGQAHRPFARLARLVRTAVFGASDLSVRGIPRMVRVPLKFDEAKIETTSFNAPWDRIAIAIARGREITGDILRFQTAMDDATDLLAARFEELLDEAGSAQRIRMTLSYLKEWEIENVRTNRPSAIVATPAHQVANAFGLDMRAFPIAGSVMDEAIRTGTPAVAREERGSGWRLAFPPLPIAQATTTGRGRDARTLMVLIEGTDVPPKVADVAWAAYIETRGLLSPILKSEDDADG